MAAPLALGDRRLIVVTGKGGVGKSTIAAALARVAAGAGRRVLAVDVAEAGLAPLLGAGAAGAEPTSLAPGLAVARIDPAAALGDVVHGVLPLGVLARRLLASTTFQIVAAAAPGLAEYLLLAKIAGWVDARRLGRPRWDLVIVDAPATGHSLPLLTAPRTLGRLVRIGPAARTLARLDALLGDPATTAVWIVTLPEELPVREAIELHGHLAGPAALPVAPPIVNAVPPRRFSAAEARWLAGPDAPAHPAIASARVELVRRRAALAHLAALRRATRVAPVALPYAAPEDGARVSPDLEARIARLAGLGR